jgi:hypothetical protein
MVTRLYAMRHWWPELGNGGGGGHTAIVNTPGLTATLLSPEDIDYMVAAAPGKHLLTEALQYSLLAWEEQWEPVRWKPVT